MNEEIEAGLLKRFQPIRKIAQGAYGIVWKMYDTKNDEIVALKKQFDAFQNVQDAKRTYREIKMLMEFNHPKVIKIKHLMSAENQKDVYMVFDFFPADLTMVMEKKLLTNPDHIAYVTYQLCLALYYIHSGKIVHRDLKPSNILINEKCEIILCDFGLARRISSDKEDKPKVLTDYVATRYYRAPEILFGKNTHYDESMDMWAVGCILGEMLVGKQLFSATSHEELVTKIIELTGTPTKSDLESMGIEVNPIFVELFGEKTHTFDSVFASVPPKAVQLVQKLLSLDPKKRPTALQVLQDNYLYDFYNPAELVDMGKTRLNLATEEEMDHFFIRDFKTKLFEETEKKKAERKAGLLKCFKKT